jgi:hypothetical protein
MELAQDQCPMTGFNISVGSFGSYTRELVYTD